MRTRASAFWFLVILYSAIVVPVIPRSACSNEEQKETIKIIRSLAVAIQSYNVDEDKYPKAKDSSALAKAIEPDYIGKCPSKDAWGNELVYKVSKDRKHFRIASPGADGLFEEGSTTIGKAGVPFPCQDLNADIIWEDDAFIQNPLPDESKQ